MHGGTEQASEKIDVANPSPRLHHHMTMLPTIGFDNQLIPDFSPAICCGCVSG